MNGYMGWGVRHLIFILVGCVPALAAPNVLWILDKAYNATHKNEAKFTVPEEHHFNTEAPAEAESLVGQVWVKADTIEIKGRELVGRWKKKIDNCHLKATFYVCDDKNTYCLPQTQVVNCMGSLKKPGAAAAGSATGSGSAVAAGPGSYSGSSSSPSNNSDKNEENFIVNDARKALELAKSNHKPLLIDFYGIWCPPCNQLNETVFNLPAFHKLSEGFVLLKLECRCFSELGIKVQI